MWCFTTKKKEFEILSSSRKRTADSGSAHPIFFSLTTWLCNSTLLLFCWVTQYRRWAQQHLLWAKFNDRTDTIYYVLVYHFTPNLYSKVVGNLVPLSNSRKLLFTLGPSASKLRLLWRCLGRDNQAQSRRQLNQIIKCEQRLRYIPVMRFLLVGRFVGCIPRVVPFYTVLLIEQSCETRLTKYIGVIWQAWEVENPHTVTRTRLLLLAGRLAPPRHPHSPSVRENRGSQHQVTDAGMERVGQPGLSVSWLYMVYMCMYVYVCVWLCLWEKP